MNPCGSEDLFKSWCKAQGISRCVLVTLIFKEGLRHWRVHAKKNRGSGHKPKIRHHSKSRSSSVPARGDLHRFATGI